MAKVVALSPDGSKFQFISGGLFKISFGLFQVPDQSIEILMNNKVIATSVKGKLSMLKWGDQGPILQNIENSQRNGNVRFSGSLGSKLKAKTVYKQSNELFKVMGYTFEDYLIVEFGSWIGIRLVGSSEPGSAEAFIRILKV
jgi:hypothetical protein